MYIVQEHLSKLLAEQGYDVKIDQQSIWENYAPPQHVDLVLQLMPAFTEEELEPPSLLVRPFLKTLDDPKTLDLVFEAVALHYPSIPDPAQAG